MLIGWENDEAAVDAGVKAWGMLQGLSHAQREGVWVDKLQKKGHLWNALC